MPTSFLDSLLRGRSAAAFRRYAIVGAAQNALFYGIMLLALGLGAAAWKAMALLYPVATTLSFFAHRSWSFGARTISRWQFPRYVFVYTAAYPSVVCLTWFQEEIGVPSWLALLVTMAVAVIGIYLALDRWVFRHAGSATERAG
jgi:putative flippase GtrA